MTITTKLDRRFLNTRVDPNDKVAWDRWQMDLNSFLDDISRAVYSTAPFQWSEFALVAYLKTTDAAMTYLPKVAITQGKVTLVAGAATVATAAVTETA
jgi:hypothetical protein